MHIILKVCEWLEIKKKNLYECLGWTGEHESVPRGNLGEETAAEIERPEDKNSARVARECMEKT